jgi:hypothetical protein
MWYPRVVPVAVSFSFLFLLTIPSAVFGQRLGGGRTGGHLGGAVRTRVGGNVAAPAVGGGAQVRPVPLTVRPRATVNNAIRPSQPGFAGVGLNGVYRSRVGDPHDARLLSLRGKGFDPFGFQHHHFGFFFNKFAFFSGFPFFFPSFIPFDPFAFDRVGLYRVPQRHLGVPGIGRRRVRFFDHQPFPFGGFFGWPYFGTSIGYESPDVFTDTAYADDTNALREISLGQQLELSGVAAGDTLEVERVSLMDIVPRAVIRLTWRNQNLPAAQVALFLADSSQSVLSAQTLRSPPFTALFEPHPGTAFVGMTVVWPDGTLSTRFVPYPKGPR